MHPARLWREGWVEYLGVRAPRSEWCRAGKSRLWLYERHYHSELPGLARLSPEEACGLIDDWVANNPPCAGEAWEPYPVARRLLNWSLACAIAPTLRSHLVPWLAAQMRFLAAHLERHLLGNHLLCDLCALVAAAAVVDAPDATELARRVSGRLERELARQVLPDGGYAERTAQYHLVVLQDALLAMALRQARGHALGCGPVLRRMLAWADKARRPDGSFPWLNDAAPGTTPLLAVVGELAQAAGLDLPALSPEMVVELPDTGWTIVRDEQHELLFEHGVVGPEHQPGHGHADALSFELVWAGLPLVCDTGVTTYDSGSVRAFERSAAAHATISVNGEGADETWASFRVGGRSHTVYLGHRSPWPGAWLLHAQARSYRGWSHRRGLLFWPGRLLVVCDEVVEAVSGAAMVSTLPLAPCWTATTTPAGARLASPARHLDLVVLCGRLVEMSCGIYPSRGGWVGCGFGRARDRTSISFGPDQGGRIVYAIAGLAERVSLQAGTLAVVSGESSRRIALDEILP
jgi:hypothetical protein